MTTHTVTPDNLQENAPEQLQVLSGSSRLRGLRPLLSRELQRWWGTHRWLIHTLLWLGVFGGMLALVLFVLPNQTTPDGEPVLDESALDSGVQMFIGMGALLLSVGAVVVMQDSVLGEKQTGTAAWVLSKPASRFAFILSRLLASIFSMLITMIVVPGLGAFLLFYLYEPGVISPLALAKAQSVIALHTFFYLALTLLLSATLENRSAVLGIPLALALGGSFLPLGQLVRFTPLQLSQVSVSYALNNDALGSIGTTMIVATAVWSLLFVIATLWRFERVEF